MTPRQRFLLLAALFAAPVAAAMLLYFGFPEWRPEGHVNYGTLIVPARPVPDLRLVGLRSDPAPPDALKGKWSLVYLAGPECDAGCEQRLYLTRQVRLALHYRRTRVQRIYIAPDAAALQAARARLAAAHPDLVFLAESEAGGARAAGFFGPAGAPALYLVDPLGNWLMTYAGALEPSGLHRDLKKLLRHSQAG